MSDYTRLDKATYESSRDYLKSALEHMLEAGRSAREFNEFAMEKFGDGFLPYLQQFLRDVCCGQIIVDGLARSAVSTLLGHQVTDEERERMIRETAYLLAEQRRFWGGSSEQDWLEAEQQVDMQLARAAGMIGEGGRVLASATALMEKELANSRKAVLAWLDENFPATPAVKRAAGRKKTSVPAVKSATARRRTPGAGKRPAATRTPVKKKAAAGNKAAATKKKAAVTKKRAALTNKLAAAPTRKKAASTKKPAAAPTRKKAASTKKLAAAPTRKKAAAPARKKAAIKKRVQTGKRIRR